MDADLAITATLSYILSCLLDFVDFHSLLLEHFPHCRKRAEARETVNWSLAT